MGMWQAMHPAAGLTGQAGAAGCPGRSATGDDNGGDGPDRGRDVAWQVKHFAS